MLLSLCLLRCWSGDHVVVVAGGKVVARRRLAYIIWMQKKCSSCDSFVSTCNPHLANGP